MADESPGAPTAARRPGSRRSQLLFRAPSPLVSAVGLSAVLVALAAIAWLPKGFPQPFTLGLLFVFVLPWAVAAALTTPVARLLGGRLAWRRSGLLALTSALLSFALLALWRLIALLPALPAVSLPAILLLLQGPVVWFRHMTLFGVSQPSHARSLPPSLLPALVGVVGVFAVYPPTPGLVIAAGLDLALGFGCAALLLRAADRPLRREFSVSGVALIRPLIEHVNQRDPAATQTIEAFFRRFAIPADLRVTLLSFSVGARRTVTLALPTVHPGPFAALGASDLPRKLEEALGPEAGTVLVPHTPCNHDLDLPTGEEVARVSQAARDLLGRLPTASSRVSPLVAARDGALARAQVLGDGVLVVISQAPGPTDDIDYSVADQLFREFQDVVPLAIVDAHNSYVEDQGDLIYGTPAAHQMLEDARASIGAALSRTSAGPLKVGVAVRTGYSIGVHGIGPAGIRAIALEGADTTTAYVLIDGNNLVIGLRERILAQLGDLVDAAELWTTDNHVVHEVDGGVNPVGERYPIDRLSADIREVVQAAIDDLASASASIGCVPIPSVPVLGPGWTARLLTSLGDTFSMFTNALVTTFLLLLAGSVIVLLALR